MSPVVGGIIFIVVGLFVASLAFKRIRKVVIDPLQEQKILPKIKARKEDLEILKGAGPDLSLLFGGAILIVIGTILIISS